MSILELINYAAVVLFIVSVPVVCFAWLELRRIGREHAE